MRARTAVERLPRGIARLSDRLLEFVVLAFAAWTVIYHASLAVDVAALAAGAVWAAALVPAAWLAFRAPDEREAREPEPRDDGERQAPGGTALRVANVPVALTGAALYAFTDTPWSVVWALWIAAAALALAATVPALRGRRGDERHDRTPRPAAADAAVVLAWGVALATLSLFLVNPSGDDTHYVHLSAWVAAHGEFPLRDILFSTQDLPAVIFPPVSSLEALAGTVARATGLAVLDLVYLVITPVGSALAVLSLWRLLRAWRVPMIGVALSLSVLFLLLTAEEHRMLGNLFVSRIWQGKVIFLAVLVPLLFALLHEYAEAPTRRRLALLAAAGAVGVGLTSTGTFLVPLVAAGALLPVALRSLRPAVTALAATVAYPFAMAAGIVVVGPRNAAVTRPENLVPEDLVERTLGEGGVTFVTLAAVLVAPVVLRRPLPAGMAAATVLLVGLLYAPGVPLGIFRLTGLGMVQWRWMWAIPAAVLVAVVGTGLLGRVGPRALRAAPAVALIAALVVLGTPVWSPDTGATIARTPAWKQDRATLRAAEQILDHLEPGERLLAPREVTQTVLVMSGEVTAAAPRDFYTRSLRGVRGAHARARLRLLRFAENGLGPVESSPDIVVRPHAVAEALEVVRVDLACVPSAEAPARRLLVEQGYSPAVATETLVCLRAPQRR